MSGPANVGRALPSTLPRAQREVVTSFGNRLCALPGVVALVLGGSHARGVARADSDVDLGLYYREEKPFAIDAVREVVADFQPEGEGVVTDFFEWGAWVNGGAWIDSAAGRVDLLYREVEHVQRVIEAAWAGEPVWDYAQQPTYGFHSVIYLAETRVCIPLFDPDGALAALKARVAEYPPALRAAIVQRRLWSAEFTLRHTRAHAGRGDVYNTAGCLTRIAGDLTQALFALNEEFFISDKGALDATEQFARRPADYAARLTCVLAAPGADAAALRVQVDASGALFAELVELAGPLYQSYSRELAQRP